MELARTKVLLNTWKMGSGEYTRGRFQASQPLRREKFNQGPPAKLDVPCTSLSRGSLCTLPSQDIEYLHHF